MSRAIQTAWISLLCPFVLLIACESQDPTQPLDLESSFAISDAAHGDDGNEHFLWLPPMVTPAPTVTGVFDSAADPTLDIFKWSVVEDQWVATGLTFGIGDGLILNPTEEWYGADWSVFDDPPVAAGDLFRVSVTASGQELGYADLMIVDKVKGELKKTLGGEYVLLGEEAGKKVLKIRFRIEEGAVIESGELYRMGLNFEGGSLGVAVYDIADIHAIHPVGEFRVINWGSGFDVDQAGNLFVAHNSSPTRGSLRIYDPDLTLVGFVDVEPADYGNPEVA